VVLCTFFIGALRLPALPSEFQPNQIEYYLNQKTTIAGNIASSPERTESSQSFLLTDIQIMDTSGKTMPVKGKVLVQTVLSYDLTCGDRLELTGNLNPAGGTSSEYQAYLKNRGISGELYYPRLVLSRKSSGRSFSAWMLGLRDFTESVIRKIFPQPESALVAGVLLGRDNDLPPELVSAYQATGTAHIFAVSGFNIAIMAGVFSAVFRRLFSKWKAALAAILGIIFYTLLVGGSASVVRAAIMGSLGIVAELIGRRSSGVTSLAFTAAVMCLFSPQLPWDVSFQLTFMATLGLMLFATPLEHGLERMLAKRLTSEKARQWAEPIAEYFLFTLAAQAMTLPVIVYHFHRPVHHFSACQSAGAARPALLMVLSLIATLLG